MAATLTVMSGGAAVDFDAQERKAWQHVADGVARGLRELDVDHPERGEMLALWTDARKAAGLPIAANLTTVS
ncbi:MAG: hypothetical protein JWM93_1398 [Frankiales bacterium]|nr:hypothetical protein [Frankiales bacterium]